MSQWEVMPLRLDETELSRDASPRSSASWMSGNEPGSNESLDSTVGQPFGAGAKAGRLPRSSRATLFGEESAGHSEATSSHGKSQFTEWLEDEIDRIALRTPGSAALSQKDKEELRERVLRSPPKTQASLDELDTSIRGHEEMPAHLAKLSKRLAEPERPRLSRARPSHRARLIDEASSEQAKRVEVYEKEKEARAEEFSEKRARLAQAQKRLEQADATLAAKIAKRTGGRLFMLEGLEGHKSKGSPMGSIANEGSPPSASGASSSSHEGSSLEGSSQGSARTDTSERSR